MIIVVADTSGLLAAYDDRHPDGPAARHALDTAGTLVISPALLSELDHMARRLFGFEPALRIVDDVRRWVRAGRAVIPEVSVDVLDVAQGVRARYRDLRLDLVDAVNVALAAEFRTNVILTVDRRDFRTVRPVLAEHKHFRLLPDDLRQ